MTFKKQLHGAVFSVQPAMQAVARKVATIIAPAMLLRNKRFTTTYFRKRGISVRQKRKFDESEKTQTEPFLLLRGARERWTDKICLNCTCIKLIHNVTLAIYVSTRY